MASSGFLLLAAVTFVVGWAVTGGDDAPGWVERTDVAVSHDIAEARTPRLDAIGEGATHLSDPWTVGSVLVGAVCVLVAVRRWSELTLLLVGLAGEVAVYLTVAFAVDRQRPDVAMGTEPTASFPSGHVAAAVVLYAGLATVVARLAPDDDPRPLRVVVVGVVAALAASRLYLGMHYLSDVLVGLALGAGCLVVAGRVADAAFPAAGSEPAPTAAPAEPEPAARVTADAVR